MYQYILGLVLKRIKRNIKFYLLIMVEIFICVFLLNSGLTLHNSIKIEYESRKNDPDSKFFLYWHNETCQAGRSWEKH